MFIGRSNERSAIQHSRDVIRIENHRAALRFLSDFVGIDRRVHPKLVGPVTASDRPLSSVEETSIVEPMNAETRALDTVPQTLALMTIDNMENSPLVGRAKDDRRVSTIRRDRQRKDRHRLVFAQRGADISHDKRIGLADSLAPQRTV